MPAALRPLVGKTEVWASLGTKDERKANIKIGAVNAAIEAEWARLRAGGLPGPDPELVPAPSSSPTRTCTRSAASRTRKYGMPGSRTRRPVSAS